MERAKVVSYLLKIFTDVQTDVRKDWIKICPIIKFIIAPKTYRQTPNLKDKTFFHNQSASLRTRSYLQVGHSLTALFCSSFSCIGMLDLTRKLAKSFQNSVLAQTPPSFIQYFSLAIARIIGGLSAHVTFDQSEY